MVSLYEQSIKDDDEEEVDDRGEMLVRESSTQYLHIYYNSARKGYGRGKCDPLNELRRMYLYY